MNDNLCEFENLMAYHKEMAMIPIENIVKTFELYL